MSPQFIEIRLRSSTYIKDCVVVGEGRDYASVIVIIDFSNVSKWAEAHHLVYTTFTDLSQKDEIAQLILADVQKVNRLLPSWSNVRKFVLLHKELDPDEAELTRSRKLRRQSISEKYESLLVGMYGDKETVPIEAVVAYRDGRTGVVKTELKIRQVDKGGSD